MGRGAGGEIPIFRPRAARRLEVVAPANLARWQPSLRGTFCNPKRAGVFSGPGLAYPLAGYTPLLDTILAYTPMARLRLLG
jgi:hypothetical protein